MAQATELHPLPVGQSAQESSEPTPPPCHPAISLSAVMIIRLTSVFQAISDEGVITRLISFWQALYGVRRTDKGKKPG